MSTRVRVIVLRSSCNFFHYFAILKILINLSPLNNEMTLLLEDIKIVDTTISMILETTIIASRILYLSLTNPLQPKPISLSEVSRKKNEEKAMLEYSMILLTLSISGYLSKAKIAVLTNITKDEKVMNNSLFITQ